MSPKESVNSLAMSEEGDFKQRKLLGLSARIVFQVATLIAILLLIILLISIVNNAFGYVAMEYERQPEELLAGRGTFEELSVGGLTTILEENLSSGLIRRYKREGLFSSGSKSRLISVIYEKILKLRVVDSWSLYQSLFQQREILRVMEQNYPKGSLEFRSWVNANFLTSSQSSVPELAGIRTAIIGTMLIMVITIVVSFPLGVGTAIYLEEYAPKNWITRMIQLNIYNLAGIPSIVYGLLGLVVFVRIMEPVTSGALFGAPVSNTENGRTIISAGLTLSLLILPIIIINSCEAIRAIPPSLKEASYGVGATKWQTIWHHLLPNSMARILTGVIISISRAIGETAPIVVVGASTFITQDPTSIFSKFTTLTIQIYQWTSRPQHEFRHIASAGIIILLGLLLTINIATILLRNHMSKRSL